MNVLAYFLWYDVAIVAIVCAVAGFAAGRWS